MSTNGQESQPNGFDRTKRLGFELFTSGRVRRVTQALYAVKSRQSGSYLVENKDGTWACDCGEQSDEVCPHVYATQLLRLTNQIAPAASQNSDEPLKCRYCGSPDLNRCGFRYNARGIARRYFCNDCRRKFSMKYMELNSLPGKSPSELLWVLNEIAVSLGKLNDLLVEANKHITSVIS